MEGNVSFTYCCRTNFFVLSAKIIFNHSNSCQLFFLTTNLILFSILLIFFFSIIKTDTCSDVLTYVSGDSVFFKAEVSSTKAVINGTQVSQIYVSQTMDDIVAVTPEAVTFVENFIERKSFLFWFSKKKDEKC